MFGNELTRADEFAEREAALGGPSALVSSLIGGQRRMRQSIRIAYVGLVLDLILSVSTVFLLLTAFANQNQIRINSDAIRATASVQTLYNWHQCERSALNATLLNDKNSKLVAFLQQVPHKTPQLEQFIALSTVKLTVPVCGPRP